MTRTRWARLALPLLLLLATAALAQEPPVDVPVDLPSAPEADAGGGAFRWVALAGGVAIVGVLAAVGRSLAPLVALVSGLIAVFLGERLFGDGAMRWPLTGLGLVGVGVSLALRGRGLLGETEPSRRAAWRVGLMTAGLTAASLVVYALGSEAGAAALGFEGSAADRWRGVFGAITPVVLLAGLVPTLFVDRALADNPIVLPVGAGARAARAGLATALALAMLFPINYVARSDRYLWEADYSYFRVTGVGGATRAVARELPEPVVATLYFSPGSEVRDRVEPYFRELSGASDGMFSYEVVDSALRPDLAEAHGVRENGYVVLARGENEQKFKLGTDLDRAKRELKKLDGTVQKHLRKLSSDEQVVYFLSGHGEGSWRERENPTRKLREFKTTLEDLNLKVEVLGVTEGSAVAIPDDAALLVVASPLVEILPEEEAALLAYLDRGGALLLMLDPGAARMSGLLARLGLSAGEAPIAHETAYIPQRRGIADRVLIATNRFGTHEAVTTVSRNSTRVGLVMPTVLALGALDGAVTQSTVLVRSFPDAWEDLDGDREKGSEEPSRVFDLAMAVEGPGDGAFRAIVVGDVSTFSDPAYAYSQGNQLFAEDAAKWLLGDEDQVGETEREEDVEIRHTREGEGIWFWGTILGVPLLLTVAGGIFVNLRRST